jgi:amicoumacin kinase
MTLVSFVKKAWTVARLLPQAFSASRQRRQWARAVPPGTARLWNGEPGSLQLLTVAKHAVYAFNADGRAFIMKVAATGHREERAILTEIAWVQHLARTGLPVCVPIASVNARFVEPILLRGHNAPALAFTVERAPGMPSDPADLLQWPCARIETWGAIAGKIHAASRTFRLPEGAVQREMISMETFEVARQVLAGKRARILEQLRRVIEVISSLPRTPDWYGMIHGDLTPVNLACEGETLTLFDFESSSYSWFTYDLASPLYSLFVHGLLHRIDGLTDKLGIFFASFMRGYVRGNILRPEAVECLPAFITFLGLLNIALFHDQKSGAHTKRIQAVVEEIALRQQLQRSIQFSSIYDEILQSVQGTSL